MRGFDPVVEVGYRAAHAPWVHEIGVSKAGKPFHYTEPGTGSKFLERAVQQTAGKAPATVANHARVPAAGGGLGARIVAALFGGP